MTAGEDHDAVRAEIQRVLSSKAFETSETQRRLLSYLARKSISGEADRLKEYTIGVEAFGKPSEYDPQEDSIVRNQASRLRLKLLDYYRAEGRSDPITIDLPKGGFRLTFQPAQPGGSVAGGATGAPGARPSGRAYLPWVVAAILGLACAVLGYRLALRSYDRFTPVVWPLSRVVNSRQPTVIVLDDSKMAMLRFLIGAHNSLQEYVSGDYPRAFLPADATPRESKLLNYLASSTMVSFADAANIKSIAALAGRLAPNIVVRFARDLRSRDLRQGNYIFMGSPIVNPWVSLFQDYLNFKEDDELVSKGEKYFLNRKPLPGEAPSYRWSPAGGVSYGTIALLPGENHNGNVLILQGLDQGGTEAVGLALSEPIPRARLREALAQRIPHPEDVWFEALIRAESIAGAPRGIDVVAVRVIR